MKKIVHCGYMATMGKLVCGKRGALVDSTLEWHEITCKSCLGHMIDMERKDAVRLESLARTARNDEQRLIGRLKEVRGGR